MRDNEWCKLNTEKNGEKKNLRKYVKENENIILSKNLNKSYESGYNTNLASGHHKNQCVLYNKNSTDLEVFC